MKRDLYDSPQQWATLNNIKMTPGIKSVVFLLWRDLQVEIKHKSNRIKNLEKALKRANELKNIYKKRKQ